MRKFFLLTLTTALLATTPSVQSVKEILGKHEAKEAYLHLRGVCVHLPAFTGLDKIKDLLVKTPVDRAHPAIHHLLQKSPRIDPQRLLNYLVKENRAMALPEAAPLYPRAPVQEPAPPLPAGALTGHARLEALAGWARATALAAAPHVPAQQPRAPRPAAYRYPLMDDTTVAYGNPYAVAAEAGAYAPRAAAAAAGDDEPEEHRAAVKRCLTPAQIKKAEGRLGGALRAHFGSLPPRAFSQKFDEIMDLLRQVPVDWSSSAIQSLLGERKDCNPEALLAYLKQEQRLQQRAAVYESASGYEGTLGMASTGTAFCLQMMQDNLPSVLPADVSVDDRQELACLMVDLDQADFGYCIVIKIFNTQPLDFQEVKELLRHLRAKKGRR